MTEIIIIPSDTLKDLTINDAEYYVSNSETTNYAKGYPASDPKTVTRTSEGKGNVVDTSNGKLQQKLLSNLNLPVVVPKMNPSIDDSIAPIGGGSQTLLTSSVKEVVSYTACGGACINRTQRQVIQMGVDRSTPGDTGMDVRSKPAPYPVRIGGLIISPAWVISRISQVGRKQ